jgi:hypothetical protein
MSIKQDIINKVRKLDQLDHDCKEFSYEAKTPRNNEEFIEFIQEIMGICGKAFDLQNEIQLLLGEVSNINIQDKDVEKVLRNIRDGKDSYPVRQYKKIASSFNQSIDDVSDKFEIDAFDFVVNNPDTYSNFHEEVDYVAYFTRSMSVGALISRRQIPETSRSHFQEIREAYSFGLFRSSIAICRTLLEVAFFESLSRVGYFKKNQSKVVKIDLAKEDKLFRLIKEAYQRKLIDYDTKEDAFFIKNEANVTVLHVKDSKPIISEESTYEIIKKTIGVVEQLYNK